jgi:hypothetical protein
MNYFKNNSNDLENFLKKSKNKIEKSINRMGVNSFKQETGNFLPSLVGKIIKRLDALTKEEKILWSREKNSLLRGIILEDCIFSDYRIIIEKWNMPNFSRKKIAGNNYNNEEPFYNSNNNFQKFKISFVKGILNAEKVEYIIDFEENHNNIKNLFKTIETKFSQQKN